MAKQKAKTLQKQLGFVDDDLKTPKHDEIMQWIDKNAEGIINNLFYKDWTEEREKFEKDIFNRIPDVIKDRQVPIAINEVLIKKTQDSGKIKQLKERIAIEEEKIQKLREWKGFADHAFSKPKLKVIHKEWEYPITKKTESRYSSGITIIGFVDMKIEYEDYVLVIKKGLLKEGTEEHDVSQRSAWDFSGSFELSHNKERQSIYIEAKSEIKSLGELIRQINVYRTYKKGNYFIASPDNRYIDILKEQGIGFIKYEG